MYNDERKISLGFLLNLNRQYQHSGIKRGKISYGSAEINQNHDPYMAL